MTAVYTPTLVVPSCSPTLPSPIEFGILGGGKFALPILPNIGESLLSLALRGFQLAAPAYAAQAPIIVLLRAVAAIKTFIEDLPENVLNPPGLVASINNLVTSLAAIVSLAVPAVAFGQQVLGTIRLLRFLLQAIQAEVVRLAARQVAINEAIAKATELGNASMLATAQCAQLRLAGDVDLINRSVATSVGPVFALVNALLCVLVGHGTVLPVVPSIDVNNLVASVFDPVLTALTALETVVSAIAAPGVSFDC